MSDKSNKLFVIFMCCSCAGHLQIHEFCRESNKFGLFVDLSVLFFCYIFKIHINFNVFLMFGKYNVKKLVKISGLESNKQ